MSKCCVTNEVIDKNNKKARCPNCNNLSLHVLERTILHHIKKPWQQNIKGTPFYFCSSSSCQIIFFNIEKRFFTQEDLHTHVGIKSLKPESLLCYCFNVTRQDYLEDSSSKQFVINQTKSLHCSCETTNPSGQCCLKDFPK